MHTHKHSAPGTIDASKTMGRLHHIKQQLRHRQEGKIGWIFLWLIGVPVPLLLVFFLLRGCT